VLAIELASSLSFTDVDPIGRTVTDAPEAVSIDKGFEQDGFIAVSVFPIVVQTFGGGGEAQGRRQMRAMKDQVANLCSGQRLVFQVVIAVRFNEVPASVRRRKNY